MWLPIVAAHFLLQGSTSVDASVFYKIPRVTAMLRPDGQLSLRSSIAIPGASLASNPWDAFGIGAGRMCEDGVCKMFFIPWADADLKTSSQIFQAGSWRLQEILSKSLERQICREEVHGRTCKWYHFERETPTNRHHFDEWYIVLQNLRIFVSIFGRSPGHLLLHGFFNRFGRTCRILNAAFP